MDVLSALAAAPRGRGWAEMGLCGDLVCRVSLVAPHRLFESGESDFICFYDRVWFLYVISSGFD